MTLIRLDSKKIFDIFCLFIWILGGMCLLMESVHYLVSDLPLSRPTSKVIDKVAWLFDLDDESNISTWFNSFMLGCSSGVLWCISKSRQVKPSKIWVAMAIFLMLLSLDEVAMIHEFTGSLIKAMFPLPLVGIPRTWVIVGIGVLFLVVPLFMLHIKQFSGRIKRLVVLSGVLFFGGAVGMEVVSAIVERLYYTFEHDPTFVYVRFYEVIDVVLYTIEEVMEMFGSAVYLYALMQFLGECQNKTNKST